MYYFCPKSSETDSVARLGKCWAILGKGIVKVFFSQSQKLCTKDIYIYIASKTLSVYQCLFVLPHCECKEF
jgi:hypothetical protein